MSRGGATADELAIDGGRPARQAMLPYGRQSIDEDDVRAVVEVLKSDWLTTGPKVDQFERGFADLVGVGEAVAVSSGTAALHAAAHAAGIGPGHEVIVPPLTFAATANCVIYQGAVPVFADVDGDTLLLDPASVEAKITPRTRAIIAVDYAGQSCNYEALLDLARRYGLVLVADACHSLGGAYRGRPVGSLADLNVFSFHPVKLVTTGEGGMIATDDHALAQAMRVFRNHGITSDHQRRAQEGSSSYEMVDLGFNYRLSDLQCGLGLSQLRKVRQFVLRRQSLAALYDRELADFEWVEPLRRDAEVSHAYHLYVVKLDTELAGMARAEAFSALRAENIGVNVHYPPVHLHPYYREKLGTTPGLCPVAEQEYERLLSLPIFPTMTESDVHDVVRALEKLGPSK